MLAWIWTHEAIWQMAQYGMYDGGSRGLPIMFLLQMTNRSPVFGAADLSYLHQRRSAVAKATSASW